jgi:serine/threonine-protein kinase
MSEAYLAHDCQTGSAVVLKLPHPQLIGDPTTFSRFEREVEIGRRLAHPNIQHLLGTGRLPDGFAPYIVLEYVDGESLRTYLADHKPLSVEQALEFAKQLTAALSYVHQHGVVHRDLKPENILVDATGQLKLMDFGIALLQGARRVTWGSLSSAVGTPDYMAPEQVRGERGDERTDVYAVGVILYEMLAGEVPFQGDNALSIMSQRVTRDAPSIVAARPDAPTALAAVVGRAIARDPAKRYPTMAALANDLSHLDEVDPSIFEDSLTGESGLPSPAITWIVVGLVLLALVVIGVVAELAHRTQALH